MSLYDADRAVDVAPEQAIVIAHRFVSFCKRWADTQGIPRATQQVAETPTAERAAKLHAWASFSQFLDHTLRELEDGTLDGWFTGADGVTSSRARTPPAR
jgi:hypothetical protein